MTKTLRGVVHGRTIELDQDLGVPEGQEVEIQVTLRQPTSNWGEGIRRSAGGWLDHPELDEIMEEIHRGRKVEYRQQWEAE